MPRILLRSPKSPFEVVSPAATLARNLIATNSGNLVFLEAAWKLLSAPGVEIEPDRLSTSSRDADEINERFDAYVIPLANAFRRRFEPNLTRMTELLRLLRIPVVVLGVGAQGTLAGTFGALRPMEPTIKAFVAAVLDRSPSIGVRGELSMDYLNGLGFRDVEVIGCPSMFMWGEDLHVAKRNPVLGRDARLGITISPYREVMGPLAMATYARYPRLAYIAQDIATLELLLDGESAEAAQIEDALPIHTSHPFFREGRIRLYVDPWPWIDDLRGFDFVFGTRIHGAITSLLAGTPAYVLAHDSRTAELARYFAIPHRALARTPPDLDPAVLYEEADFTSLNAGHAARFATFTAFMARHGLDHAFAHPGAADAFDARVGRTRYPGAVTADPSRAIAHGLGARLRRRRRALVRSLRDSAAVARLRSGILRR